MYMFGGERSSFAFNDIWAFSFEDQQWSFVVPATSEIPRLALITQLQLAGTVVWSSLVVGMVWTYWMTCGASTFPQPPGLTWIIRNSFPIRSLSISCRHLGLYLGTRQLLR